MHAAGINLVSARRALRITHVWEDKLCVWHPKYDTLKALITPPDGQSTVPALLIQVLEAGEAKWLENDMHNYAHLLRVAVPRNPVFLSVKATLKHLAAYTAEFAPPEALDELASYLLSWAATVAPFEMLSAEQLRRAAASDQGALQAAQALSRKQLKDALTFTSARPVLVQNLCDAITRTGKRHKEALLVSSIVQRFFSELPLKRLVILLGRLLPLLRSTATPGTPLLQASGKTAGSKAGPARIMHTMASITPCEHTVWCSALSAEVCGLRHFQLTFYPPITSLAHVHSERKPPRRSRPDGNTRFPSGTLLLLEVSFAASHDQVPEHRLRTTAQGQAHIQAIRRLHGFTIATEPIELPAGPWPLAHSAETSVPSIRALPRV